MTVLTGIWQIVTSLSIVSQVFILAIATIWLLFNIRYTTRVVELGPTILTTLGIFGTFLGVAIGLSHFDTTNVQASVPSLLAGLKTAFWASVFGVGAAVQLKLRELMIGAFTKKKPTGQSVTPLAVLVDIREALAGYGDASLSQQIRMLRQEMGGRLVAEVVGARKEATERLDAIRQGQIDTLAQMELAGMVQQKALHKLADGATESLVAALQRVVTDFNDKVGSVHRLRRTGAGPGDGRAHAVHPHAHGVLLDAIEAGENRLMVLARSMAKVTEDASGRIPFIEARIAELTSQMTRAVQDNQAAVHAALTGSAAELQRTITAMQAELSGVAQAGTAGVQENQRAIAAALQDNAASMAASLQAAQGALTTAISGFQAQMASMVEATAQRVVALDEHAASGLTQSVLHLVGNLTAQLEAASAGLADRAPRQRRVLHVVGEAGVAADQ